MAFISQREQSLAPTAHPHQCPRPLITQVQETHDAGAPDFWAAAEGKLFFREDATGRMALFEAAGGDLAAQPVLMADGTPQYAGEDAQTAAAEFFQAEAMQVSLVQRRALLVAKHQLCIKLLLSLVATCARDTCKAIQAKFTEMHEKLHHGFGRRPSGGR